MNILVLGAGEHIGDASGGSYPVFLSEIDGELLLERQVKQLSSVGKANYIFAVRGEDIASHHIDNILKLLDENCRIINVRKQTQGAACTALLAIDHINNEDELIITNATDHLDVQIDAVIAGFRDKGADAGVIVFESLHPRYSFVRVNAQGEVTEASEKRPISRFATAGFYWYRRGADFIAGARGMLSKDAHVNGDFFICPVFNELILHGKKIVTHNIHASRYFPLKSTDQLSSFILQRGDRS